MGRRTRRRDPGPSGRLVCVRGAPDPATVPRCHTSSRGGTTRRRGRGRPGIPCRRGLEDIRAARGSSRRTAHLRGNGPCSPGRRRETCEGSLHALRDCKATTRATAAPFPVYRRDRLLVVFLGGMACQGGGGASGRFGAPPPPFCFWYLSF